MPLLHNQQTIHYLTIVSESDTLKGNKSSLIGMIFKITEFVWETFLGLKEAKVGSQSGLALLTTALLKMNRGKLNSKF